MTYRRTKSAVGFTIAELLIALAITGMLLAAMAVAFNASVTGYRENEDIFKTINDARQALTRITTQLRTAEFVDPCSPVNECSFFTADESDITYLFRDADDKLYVITNSDGNEYVLCENVTSMSFIKTPTDDGSDCKNVQISMTVQNGNIQKTIAAAAVVRRNLEITAAD